MKKYLLAVTVISLLSVSLAAQSGRRAKPGATPLPAVTSSPDSDDQYSESRPTDGFSYSKKRREAPVAVQPKVDTSASSDEDTIKVETNLVSIPVSVYERSGVYVGGLRRSDFKIFEDGKEQEIAYFGTTEVPFSVVLLIDVSGSTDNKIRQIQAAAMSFIGDLRPTDRVMIVEFDLTVNTLCDFTSDRAVLEKAVHKVGSGGGTALYHAVETVLKKKFKDVQGRKAVVLFTDGVECSMGLGSGGYEDTLGLAEESDAVVYSVYYNTYFDSMGIGGGGGPMSGIPTISKPSNAPCDNPEAYTRGRTYLQELARLTGGKMFRAEATTGGLSAAFEGIAGELGKQYTIGYYPQEPGGNGQRKRIKVRVNRSNVAVRARDNYIVGAAAKTGK
jgi:Ca-activated chloride channel family protein